MLRRASGDHGEAAARTLAAVTEEDGAAIGEL